MTTSKPFLHNIINGNEVLSATGQTFNKKDPLHNKLLYQVPISSTKDIQFAIAASKVSQIAWKNLPTPKKGEILFDVAHQLKIKQNHLAHLMTTEMGKPLTETIAEVREAIDTANYFAGESRRFYGRTMPSELRNRQCLTLRMPVGICGVITPWNFPLAVPSWKIFPALLCGNTLIWKPSEEAPGTANAFVKILIASGIPMGVIHLLHGPGTITGKALVESSDISLISFTGSSVTGKEIAIKCASDHKRLSLEMGGKNAQIILPDGNLQNAIEGAVWGCFGTSGQRCTATSRIIVHKRIYTAFIKKFIARTKQLKLGSGFEKSTTLGPIINAKQALCIQRFVQKGKKEATLLYGGKFFHSPAFPKAHFFEPTIFTDVNPSSALAQEEIFGPVTSVFSCKNLDEAIQIANNSRYGLSSSIYTNDLKSSFKAINDIESGITYVNSPTIGAETHMPFGGVKQTGSGHREAGELALDIFSEWKSVYLDFSGHLQKAQVD